MNQMISQMARETCGEIKLKSPGKLFGNKEMRILMLGLDAAGKTSMFLSSPMLLFG
jgi:GTPase SAR1 family protein